MILQRKDMLDAFIERHSDAGRALRRWLAIVELSEWGSHAEIKSTFPSVDYVGDERYVFNIRGNRYRIVAVVVFTEGSMRLRFLGTHAEYMKIDCRTI
jgi:mRNA interferase HigB